MTEFEIKKAEIRETGQRRYVEGEHATLTRRSGSKSPIIVTHREVMTFEVDTPIGKTEVTYGGGGYGGDSLRATFRSQDITAESLRGDSWRSFEKKVADIEAEHRVKKARDAARKEMAKNPIPCVVIGAERPKNELACAKVYVAPKYGDAFVRGIDHRNGSALVTHADGTKGPVRAALVLRELDRDELRELELADQRIGAAVARNASAKLPHLDDALLAIDFSADLTIHYDPAADTRRAEVDGERFAAKDEGALIRQITLWALRQSGEFKYVTSSGLDAFKEIGDVEDYEYTARTFRSIEELNENIAATAAVETAFAERDALVDEFRFDLSLFAEAEKDESAVKADAEASVIGRIGKAPDVTPEWED